jgi:hypothetical protein
MKATELLRCKSKDEMEALVKATTDKNTLEADGRGAEESASAAPEAYQTRSPSGGEQNRIPPHKIPPV